MNNRTKIVIALGAAVLLAAPVAFAGHLRQVAVQDRTVVSGHTVFVSVRQFDPDIAAIAGMVEQKVVWFNGAIIFNTFKGGFALGVEDDACDPRRGQDFRFIDQDLSYIDPNGQPHVVTHYTYRCAEANPLATLLNNTTLEDGLIHPQLIPLLHFREDVWVTPTHAIIVDPTIVDEYNFALAVDTSLFDENPRGDTAHDGTGGDSTDEIKDGDSFDPATGRHTPDPAGSPYNQPHEHNTASVDLYFARKDPGGGASSVCSTAQCMENLGL